MRSYQVFRSMSPAQAGALLGELAKSAPAMYSQTLAAASVAMKARPAFLQRQSAEKRAAAVRRALARVSSNELAENVLAVYFLECRRELLIEWLDLLGIEHEEGTLKEDTPAEPASQVIRTAVEKFRANGDSGDREVLLAAFAAQTPIDWPGLDRLLGAESDG